MGRLIMAEDEKDAFLTRIHKGLQYYPDFPKPGIQYCDVLAVFKDPHLFNELITVMENRIREKFGKIDTIVGLDARGFLFAPILALKLDCAFVPVRKRGKLPGETVQVTYKLEYGEDCFELQKVAVGPGQNVVIVDDILATGGTMCAAERLVKKAGGAVNGCIVVVEIDALKGRSILSAPLDAIVHL